MALKWAIAKYIEKEGMMIKGLVTVKCEGKVVMKVFANCSGNNAEQLADKLSANWPVSAEEAYQLAKVANFGEIRCLKVQTEEEVIYHGDLEKDEELDAYTRQTFQQEEINPFGERQADDYLAVINVARQKTAAERQQEKEKVDALELISQRPATFQWRFQGTLYDKAGLLKEVVEETELGKQIILAASQVSIEPAGKDSFKLGKRAVCLKCGTQGLITKAGGGILVCCDQNMDIMGAKPIPSSD
jgi:hypothetical protein